MSALTGWGTATRWTICWRSSPARKNICPASKPSQAAPPKVNLLVDIQAKLQAGKGAGYARWAKVFNLKQMAQTLNYLSEHGLLDYADLETKNSRGDGPL